MTATAPDEPTPLEARPHVQERRADRRRRIRRIRKRAIGASAAAFAAAWAVIFFQLVSGHDPALGGTGPATAPVAAAASSPSPGWSEDDYSGDTESGADPYSDDGTYSTGPAPAAAPATTPPPVTTQQS